MIEREFERSDAVLRSLLFVCALIVGLSGKALADEAADKKVQGVRKAIDVCINLLEKEDYKGFVDKAVFPSRSEFIKKTDDSLKKCIDGLKRDRDELLMALKAAKMVEPVYRESIDPKEERAFLVLEKPIFKDRELRYFIFRERNGIWYFVA